MEREPQRGDVSRYVTWRWRRLLRRVAALFLFDPVPGPMALARLFRTFGASGRPRFNMTVTRVEIVFIEQDITVSDLETSIWQRSAPASLDKLWNGEPAPAGRRAVAHILWSDQALHVRFDAQQTEPLVVFDDPDSTVKRIGLWERDVCELFIAPDARNRRRYFEFEIAPTGEWLDLIVDWTKDEPRYWDYMSGMETFAKIEPDKVTMAMRIPWTAFGKKPEAGDVWLGNLFRQVGSGETRGYLAWSPTMTKEPNFHVPERFGEFIFRD